ncbi:MAG: hypothetical protein SNF33_07585 [Candidatus Algichlamydia australiensis]|nr:hypothetical protein [Chlamydiales bacterium]
MGRKISTFFLLFFSAIFSSELSAFHDEIEEGIPLIKIVGAGSFENGILSLIMQAPNHLTINQMYSSSLQEDGLEVEGDFILATYPSKNPQMINFVVSAQNTDEGIDFLINETQIFEEGSCCTNSSFRKKASRRIHVKNRTLDTKVKAEMVHTQACQNLGFIHYNLLAE